MTLGDQWYLCRMPPLGPQPAGSPELPRCAALRCPPEAFCQQADVWGEIRHVSWGHRLPVCHRSPLRQKASKPRPKPGWDRSFSKCLVVFSPAVASLLLLLLEAPRLSPCHKVLNYSPSACCQLGCQFLSTLGFMLVCTTLPNYGHHINNKHYFT